MLINWFIVSKFPPQIVVPVANSTVMNFAFSISPNDSQ